MKGPVPPLRGQTKTSSAIQVMSHRLPTGADYNMNGHVCLPSTPTRVLIEGLLVIGNKIRLTIDT